MYITYNLQYHLHGNIYVIYWVELSKAEKVITRMMKWYSKVREHKTTFYMDERKAVSTISNIYLHITYVNTQHFNLEWQQLFQAYKTAPGENFPPVCKITGYIYQTDYDTPRLDYTTQVYILLQLT